MIPAIVIAVRAAPLVMLVALLTGCAGETEGTDPARPSDVETLSAGELTVCSDTDRPPFAFTDKGEVRGFEIELIRAVGDKLGLEVTVRSVQDGRILASVARSMCDVGAATIPTTASEPGVELSSPYLDSRSSLLVRKADAGRFTHVGALRGQVIGIRAGAAGADQARAAGASASTVVQEFATDAELAAALAKGTVHGVIQELLVNTYETQVRTDLSVTQVFEPTGIGYAFALRKANIPLRDAVNFALAALRSDGTYDRILKPYAPVPRAAG